MDKAGELMIGAAKRIERVCAPNPQAALDRHGRGSGTGIGATKRVAVPAYGNRNRWSVGDGLKLRANCLAFRGYRSPFWYVPMSSALASTWPRIARSTCDFVAPLRSSVISSA